MAGSGSATDGRLVVLFDRDCTFCTWTMRQLDGLDRKGRLVAVALQDAGALPERPDVAEVASRYPLRDSLHVVTADGTVLTRGRALSAILDRLPGGWMLRPWTRIPGALALLDVIYDGIAAHRDQLGRFVTRGEGEACVVPPVVAASARTKPSVG